MTTNEVDKQSKKLVAVCDACTLFSITIADLLTSLSEAELFHAKWTMEIHDEWIHNLLEHRKVKGLVTREKLEARRNAMIEAIADSLVDDYQDLIPKITLPDLNDRHVVAAAIKANAQIILTMNLKDFPFSALKEWNLIAIHPDDFIVSLLNTNIDTTIEVLREMRKRRKRPPISPEEFLISLKKQNLTKLVSEIRKHNIEL